MSHGPLCDRNAYLTPERRRGSFLILPPSIRLSLKQPTCILATVSTIHGSSGVRYMPDKTELLRQLHEKAMKAFTAAGEAAKDQPVPNSPKWLRWQALCREAIDANAEYMDELANGK